MIVFSAHSRILLNNYASHKQLSAGRKTKFHCCRLLFLKQQNVLLQSCHYFCIFWNIIISVKSLLFIINLWTLVFVIFLFLYF